MKAAIALASLALVLWISAVTRASAPAAQPNRRVALTIDDLPAAAAQVMSGAEILEMTKQLVAKLKENNAPAVGFVNEREL
ncbi:MAG TPA: hypothetical protein VJP87_03680, partial [Candidatus Acidoferrales bacterium]|nr:hypothetical protein [Candidatus Acidoferrales bacterium]